MGELYIKKWNAWAPGVENTESWKEWASDKLDIERLKTVPGIKHIRPIYRRRLSQITKMVLEVGHSLLDADDNPSVILSSQFGEINQQNKISRGILEDGDVKPSAFSLSVFNAPISLLSLHEKITEPAIVILSGNNTLYTGLFTLIAELNSRENRDVLLLFADELLPEDYTSIKSGIEPYCFGLVFSSKSEPSGQIIEYNIKHVRENTIQYPLEFLKWFLSKNTKTTIGLNGTIIELLKC